MVQKHYLKILLALLLLATSACSRYIAVKQKYKAGQEFKYRYLLSVTGKIDLVRKGMNGFGGQFPFNVQADFVVSQHIDKIEGDTIYVTRRFDDFTLLNNFRGGIEKMTMDKKKGAQPEITYFNNRIKDQAQLNEIQKTAINYAKNILVKKHLTYRQIVHLNVPELAGFTNWLQKVNFSEIINSSMPYLPPKKLRVNSVWTRTRPVAFGDTVPAHITTKYYLSERQGHEIKVDYSGRTSVHNVTQKNYFGDNEVFKVNSLSQEFFGSARINYKTGVIGQINGNMNNQIDVSHYKAADTATVTTEKTDIKVKLRIDKIGVRP